ncbi:type II toxin-antitoxin system RelE/ParE family toxin [Niabella hirudinis]|uniref:type II toxin-antitoxin system RelE/ParE family toxin n=1 Tax=Niabella hirudinis TaxID=1285929 RepID=UPI003EBB103D
MVSDRGGKAINLLIVNRFWLLQKINELPARPEVHAPDKYKTNNTGNYRAFELHRYRVAYLVAEDAIIIARIRHASQAPREY